jgi:hypothetical protein
MIEKFEWLFFILVIIAVFFVAACFWFFDGYGGKGWEVYRWKNPAVEIVDHAGVRHLVHSQSDLEQPFAGPVVVRANSYSKIFTPRKNRTMHNGLSNVQYFSEGMSATLKEGEYKLVFICFSRWGNEQLNRPDEIRLVINVLPERKK